jgi:hypothetical protein
MRFFNPQCFSLCLCGLGALLALPRSMAAAQDTNAPSGTDFQSFRMISERNIFNANRSRARSRSCAPERPPKIDSFTLVGTITYEKGTFAFFEGSSSAFKKVAKCNETIAGYKVAEIGVNHVRLEADGKQLELPVGMQMRREDEGEWQRVARSESSSSTSSNRSGGSSENRAASASKEAGSSAASGDESEILKRLLQKREEELKNEKR